MSIMKTEEKTSLITNKKSSLSIALYVGGIIVALLGLASLINNAILYNSAVSQYVAAGYASSEVIGQLLPSQLLPAIFESIALYGGLAMVLFYMGLINQKVSNYMIHSIKEEINIDSLEVNVSNVEEIEEIVDPAKVTVDEAATENSEALISENEEKETNKEAKEA